MLAWEAREANVNGTTRIKLVVRRDEVGEVGRTSFFCQCKDLTCLVEHQVLKDLLWGTLGSLKIFFKLEYSRFVCVSHSVVSNSVMPGFSVHGILQTRILEWVAISFSRESSLPRDRILVSCITGRFFTI